MATPAPSLYKSDEADDLSWIHGKTLLVTGGTDGIGLAGIMALCESKSKPKRIILLARNAGKAEGVSQKILSAGIECNTVMADNSKPKQIIEACREIEKLTNRLDCIWNNAGIWNSSSKVVEKQEDDLEVHFTVNYLSMVLLVTGLRQLLSNSAPARIVVTGSFTSWEMVKGVVQMDNLQCQNGKHKLNMEQGWTYAHSKLLQHIWCKYYAGVAPDGVTINAGDPGAVETNIEVWQNLKKLTRCCFGCMKKMNGTRTPDVGCRSLLHLVGSPLMKDISGQYLDWGRKKPALMKRRPVPLEFYPEFGMAKAPSTADADRRQQLAEETEKLVAQLHQKYAQGPRAAATTAEQVASELSACAS